MTIGLHPIVLRALVPDLLVTGPTVFPFLVVTSFVSIIRPNFTQKSMWSLLVSQSAR